MKIQSLGIGTLSVATLLFSGCDCCKDCDSSGSTSAAVKNSHFDIDSMEHAALAEKAFRHWENLELESWYATLADDVQYYFPNGGAGTRTVLNGKGEVKKWFDNWKKTGGIKSMTITDVVNIPVIVKEKLAYSGLTGRLVISYFSIEYVYTNEARVNLRVNYATHFNSDNKIDRCYTYYDRTKIIETQKKDVLK